MSRPAFLAGGGAGRAKENRTKRRRHLPRREGQRWRRLTLAVGALAAVLALYIAVGQFAPELIPTFAAAGSPTTAQGTGRGPQDGLVVVLQQEPTAPAFLLTLDTQKRMLTVRRVSATPETGRSYELWVISGRSPSPRSLGVVGTTNLPSARFREILMPLPCARRATRSRLSRREARRLARRPARSFSPASLSILRRRTRRPKSQLNSTPCAGSCRRACVAGENELARRRLRGDELRITQQRNKISESRGGARS